MANFIHLRNHTEYSLCISAIKFEKLIAKAKEEKIPALAITDSHNLFGALEFSIACSKAGIQPIIGCEVLIDGSQFLFNNALSLQTAAQKNDCLVKLVLIAQTDKGYLNLIKLVSDSYVKRQPGIKPHISLEELKNKSEGLIVLSGGYDGLLGKLILNNSANINQAVEFFLNIYSDNFYMELSRHGLINEIETEQKFIELALNYNIPLVATNDCYFLTRDMFEAQDVLSCILANKLVSQENDRERATPEHYFKSDAEMEELFEDIPEAIENTINITKKINTFAYRQKSTLPHFNLPEGKTEADELKRLSYEGLDERLAIKYIVDDVAEEEKENVRKKYFDQLEFELNVIIQMDFPGYFLIVADFIIWSKNNGVPIGPGRGSGAGSVVAWSMKITDLDPIKFSLYFERFLNPERVSMPDFDVDFCQRGRNKSIEYVQNKYGKNMVAQIITFGKLQSKAVIKDVGRVLSMGYNDVDRISKMIPFGATLEEAIEQDDDLKKQRNGDPETQKLFDIALKLEGLNRHSSVHAAGIVIGYKPLDEICALYYDEESDFPAVQYQMKYVDEVGLVKFDFLGLKTLTVIKDAIDFIKKHRNINVDIENIRLDDAAIFKMLQRADSLGVFQVESLGMQSMLKQIRPDNIEDIIALISLYRPGPMDSIPTYVKRKHGIERVEYLHPKMEEILKDTYGIIIYQEQVMNIAKVLAGYTLGGADLLRRAMGKKIKEEMDKQRSVFVEGCKKNSNIDEIKSNEIFDLLAKFAEYGFNKAHAAAYAFISYQTAYLKCHYIVEFLAATMNMEIIDTDKINYYLQDVKKHNIVILPPDINKSEPYFTIETIDIQRKDDPVLSKFFNGKEMAIRYGLGALKGVGTNITVDIFNERKKNGDFKSIFDFCKRMESKVINKKSLESLSKSGCFDTISKNRRQIAESNEILSAYSKSQEEQKNSSQCSLFANMAETANTLPKLKQVDDWQGYDRFQAEFEAFGFYLKNHPLDTIKRELSEKGVLFISDLESDEVTDGCTIHLSGVIISTTIKSGPKGRYAYVTISDPDGLIELSIFNNDLITEHKNWLDDKEHKQMVFTCIIRKDEGGVRVSAKDFMLLDDYIRNTERGAKKIIKSFRPKYDKNKSENKKTDYGQLDNVDFFKNKAENDKKEKKIDIVLLSKLNQINKNAEQKQIEKNIDNADSTNNTKMSNTGANQEYNFFEPKDEKQQCYSRISITIENEMQLEKAYSIISATEKKDNNFTEIKIIINNNGQKQMIVLPNNFYITKDELYKLKLNNIGVISY